MTARAVSRAAYRAHVRSGKALSQWMRVLAAIEAHPGITRAELERETGIRINAICGRVAELVDAALVAEGERRTCGVTGEEAHGLRARSEYRGGDTKGVPRQQVLAWEDEQEALHWECLARHVLSMPRNEQAAFGARWKRNHGERSAARLRRAMRAEIEKQRRAA